MSILLTSLIAAAAFLLGAALGIAAMVRSLGVNRAGLHLFDENDVDI